MTFRTLASFVLTLSACSSSVAAPDGGPFACDAPPIAYCRVSPSAGSTCCGGPAATWCAPGGGYACGPGSQTLDSCPSCP